MKAKRIVFKIDVCNLAADGPMQNNGRWEDNPTFIDMPLSTDYSCGSHLPFATPQILITQNQ
jgi:hypothetical protein